MRSAIIVSTVVVLSVPAYAQQAEPQYDLKVTASELNVISDGLQLEPFGKVLPLINKLREQMLAQQKPPDTTKPASAPAATPEDKDASPQAK